MSSSFRETTLDLANDKSFPTDAKLIWYLKDGKECMDLVRCKKSVDLFDMYLDKYGPGSVQKIDFGLDLYDQNYGDTNHLQRRRKKMSKGFDVEVEMNPDDINRLLKRYKKIKKKYQKSSLFALQTMDGTEKIISSMIKESEDDPIT